MFSIRNTQIMVVIISRNVLSRQHDTAVNNSCCTGMYQNENLWCSQWRNFRQHDNISFSVNNLEHTDGLRDREECGGTQQGSLLLTLFNPHMDA